jgi:hypothetical protein
MADLRRLASVNGWLAAFDRVLRALSGNRMRLYKYYFLAQPVVAKPWLPPHRGASVDIRPVAASDPVLDEMPRPKAVFPYRFQQGAVCLGAFKAASCLGFVWFTFGPYQEDEVRCRYVPLPEGQSAWDFDLYLEPAHRNSVAFLKLWDEANRVLAARGIRWSLSRISAFNERSIASHQRLAARRIGTAVFVIIGSWQLSLASVKPFFFLSPRSDSFPEFALHPEYA